MDVKCTLETRKNKAGKDYQVLVIKITDSVEKLVFLDSAEIELLKIVNSKKEPDIGFPDFN